ncbi:MAG: type II CRISPR-associated endonuclease Cas1 [Bacteroidales bacterium]|nr:type II CRISPR-associated endonuclease Cas1 [Bacteroidales bacterium]MCF8455436.1 type II CRISPR-associated endonuclease Cas1 [Bacteroidales bacterium]
MIKRTLYFGNPCYLKKKQNQLLIDYPGEDKESRSVPIEDIGIVVLDHYQITITQGLLTALLENNAAVLNCDQKHLPHALMLPMHSHHAYTEKVKHQLNASASLKKNLWQQTVSAKIQNQAEVLAWAGGPAKRLFQLAKQVNSGDPDNVEGRAARFYWDALFQDTPGLKRHRFGDAPNNLLNYGYAVLRSIMARSLVSSGLLPVSGIFHRNKYNPYCLADDIMEPYRPMVDKLVLEMSEEAGEIEELTTELKQKILAVPVIDVLIANEKSPLMVACTRTSASLSQCFEGSARKIAYPDLLHT